MGRIITAQDMSPESNQLSTKAHANTKASLLHLHHNILLLHGRSDQRSEISELLGDRLGYQVCDADSGSEMLSETQLKLLKPDAVVIDVGTLPHSQQLVSTLSALMPDIAIIILVGYGEYQVAQEYLMLGAHDFITKPFAQERISVTLRNALALQDARREVKEVLRMTRPSGAEDSDKLGETAESAACGSILPLLAVNGDVRKLGDIESAVIRFAITFYNGRISTVSRKLGVGRSTLYRKLASLDRL